MKKLLITSLAVCLTLGVFAQFNKGRMMIGGSLGFVASNTEVTSSRSYSFAPNVGYFVANNFAMGMSLSASFQVNEYENMSYNSKLNSKSYSIQPFVRYYLKPGFFFHGEYGWGWANGFTEVDGEKDEYNSDVSHWKLAAGYAIMLNDNVAIEPMAGYASSKAGDSDSSGSIFINVGIQVYLGRE